MKRSQPFVYKLSIVLILSITIFFAPTQCADAKTDPQDIAKLALPEGARARLGKGTIHGIVYSTDGNQLIVATAIGIWTYNADTGKELGLLNMPVTNAHAHAFSSDRRMFASASGDPDNTVHVWDLTNRQHKTTLEGHTSHIKSIAFSPDGRTLATGSSDDTVRVMGHQYWTTQKDPYWAYIHHLFNCLQSRWTHTRNCRWVGRIESVGC